MPGVVDEILPILRHVEVGVFTWFLFGEPLECVHHRDDPVGLSRKIQRNAKRLQRRG